VFLLSHKDLNSALSADKQNLVATCCILLLLAKLAASGFKSH